jgi:dTDP-glucose pyrophosphorylase
MIRVTGKPILGHIFNWRVESPIDDVVVVGGGRDADATERW